MKVILLLLFYVNVACSQVTFSKVFDLDESRNRNYLKDFVVYGDHIYALTSHFCATDLNSFEECSLLNKFDLNGNLIGSISLDSIYSISNCANCIDTLGSSIILSTVSKRNPFRGSLLLIIDTAFSKIQKINIDGPVNGGHVANRGLKTKGDDIMLFGRVSSSLGKTDSIEIVKLDKNLQEIWRKYLTSSYRVLELEDLQFYSDTLFLLKIDQLPTAGAGARLMTLFVKMDFNGRVIDSVRFEASYPQPNAFVTTAQGDIYFSSNFHPLNPSSFSAEGRINKFDLRFKDVIWSTIFPNDPLKNIRKFIIHELIEMSDGNILLSGNVFDNTEANTPEPNVHSVDNGFLLNVGADGNVNWFRIFKIENSVSDKNSTGNFRPSAIIKIKELENGSILAMGDVGVTNIQYISASSTSIDLFQVWMMVLDKNGCIHSDCQEIIYTTKIKSSISGNEFSIFPNPVINSLNVSAPLNDNSQFIISDVLGLIVMKGNITGTIDLTDIDSGIYFFQVYSQEKLVGVKKILKL